MDRGDAYFKQKHYGEAVIEYKNALKADPTSGDGYYHLGLALLQQGRWAQAADSFARAVQFSPDNLDARLRLGDILTASGEFNEADAQAQEVLNRDPQNASAHLLLGQIQLQQKRYDAAKGEFEIARQRAPQDPVSYGNLGFVELLSGNFSNAEIDYQKAVELAPHDPQYAINWSNFYRSRQQPARAEQVLRDSMAENPHAVELPLALADLYVNQGRGADAQKVLDQTEADTKDIGGAERNVADFYFLHDNSAKALERYLQLAKKDSNNDTLVASVVECELNLHRWQEAESWINKRDKRQQDPSFQVLRARAHIGEYQLREAISELESVIQDDPGDPDAYFYLAQAELDRGNLEGAKSAYSETLSVQPGYVAALLGLGNVSLEQNDRELALQYANQVIDRAYWNTNAHILAGNAQILRGNAGAALKEFQVAAALNPSGAPAEERIGRMLAAQGKYADAEKAYESALQDDPGYSLALGGLADLYVAEGHPDRARARIESQIQRFGSLDQLQTLLGEFCLGQKDWSCSEQSFRKAEELNASDVGPAMELARFFAVTSRSDEEIAQLQTIEKKFPDYLPVYVELGNLYQEKGEIDQAKQSYQDALTINSNYPDGLNQLAWLECEHGGPLNEALELAQRAKKQMPDDPHINDTLAWIYYKQGLYPSAMDLLQGLVERYPKDPIYQFHLGMVYLNLGKHDQGRRTLETALRVGLAPENAQEAREALQKAGS